MAKTVYYITKRVSPTQMFESWRGIMDNGSPGLLRLRVFVPATRTEGDLYVGVRDFRYEDGSGSGILADVMTNAGSANKPNVVSAKLYALTKRPKNSLSPVPVAFDIWGTITFG